MRAFSLLSGFSDQQLRNGDLQIAVNSYSYRLFKRADHRSGILFITIYGGALFGRIHNPVFPNAGFRIESIFCIVVHAAAAGGDDLDNKIGSALASPVREFTLVTDDADIGFDVSFIIGVEIDGERGRINPTDSFF